jgi:hypothetical protein
LKKLITMISLLLATVALSATVIAAGANTGKVSKIEGTMVTVTMAGSVPAFARSGTWVSALGGAPKVMSVTGNDIVLRFNTAKVATIKIDASVTVSEPDEDMEGC